MGHTKMKDDYIKPTIPRLFSVGRNENDRYY